VCIESMNGGGYQSLRARLYDCHIHAFFLIWVTNTQLHHWTNAGDRMDFTKGNFKPKSASSILQAVSCRFFGCNLLVFVFVAFEICLCFV